VSRVADLSQLVAVLFWGLVGPCFPLLRSLESPLPPVPSFIAALWDFHLVLVCGVAADRLFFPVLLFPSTVLYGGFADPCYGRREGLLWDLTRPVHPPPFCVPIGAGRFFLLREFLS